MVFAPPKSASLGSSRLMTPQGGRRPLMQAGRAQLSMDEILAAPNGMLPAISMHESTLQDLWGRKEPPGIRGLGLVQGSLERDALKQSHKYGGAEPSKGAARFHVRLPQGPQHSKYSTRASTAPFGASRVLDATPNGMNLTGASLDSSTADLPPSPSGKQSTRFDKKRLKGWFKEIDQKGTGSISQRELIVALRSMKGLMAMFCMVSGIEYVDPDGSAMDGRSIDHDLMLQAKKEEVRTIKEILTEIDTDGSGSMEWDEFVEFFRRAGLLLEYQTQESYNRTSLCEPEEIEEIQKIAKAQDP